MAETREYPARWLGVWREDTNSYTGGGSPIRAGGGPRYNSYVGFYDNLKTDIQTSKTTVTVKLRIYATDGGEMDIGMHKRTSNPASGGMPYYRYAGKHPILPKGLFQEIDITNFSGDSLEIASGETHSFEGALNSGYEGIVLYGGSDYVEAYGATRNGYEVKLLVTGTWNSPPSKPTVTYPNGGESISGVTTVTWDPATDPEEPQSQLRYQVSVFDGVWHDLPLTGAGVTSLSIDFSQYKETSVAQIAVRAFDSAIDYDHGSYGEYDYSDGVFRIARNLPPTSPTGLKPNNGSVLDRSEIQSFSWVHNDEDAQSKFDLQWRVQGTATWNTITRNTSNEYVYVDSNTFPAGVIEWQVRTYDQQQLVSPWSNTAIFNAAEPSDKPEILSPAQNDAITIANPVVQWSSVDQNSFDLEVWNGNTMVWELEKVSDNKAQTIEYDLSNNTTYQFRLRVKNSDGLWSAYDTVDVSTSFTPPEQADLTLSIDEDRGSITIGINNPINVNVNVLYNNLYRREEGETEWMLIAKNIPPNFYFTDFTPKSGQIYEYMAETWGDNGTYSDSVTSRGVVNFKDAILQLVSDPESWVKLQFNPSKAFNLAFTESTMTFNKRINPVSEFGVNEEFTLDLGYTMRSAEDLVALKNIVSKKQTLLYRDSRGRREFVTVSGLKYDDAAGMDNYKISMSPKRVYFKEDLA